MSHSSHGVIKRSEANTLIKDLMSAGGPENTRDEQHFELFVPFAFGLETTIARFTQCTYTTPLNHTGSTCANCS